ncbi:MAG: hypothetical protein J5884_01740 [Paludibacteraceae bacterium]|nr:hypothetical protein [Paludibacteraceae bacterium]
MKSNNKIPLLLLQERLQAIEHYNDPARAFSELLGAWRVWTHKSWYTGAKGWLSIDDAKSFSDYAGYNLLDD